MKSAGILFLALVLQAPAVLGAASIARVITDGDLANAQPLGAWSGKRLALADVDGDGALDVIAQNANGRVYAIDPRTKALLVEVEPSYPYGPDLGPFNGPKAADLDGDGVVELVNVNRAAVVSVWRLEHEEGRLAPKLAWERHLDEHHDGPTADAGPVLGDLDADGSIDIVVQTEETGVYALRSDGSRLWSLANYGGNAEPVVRDVDDDSDLDVVLFTDGGVAYAVEGANGTLLWRFDARHHGAWPASITAPGVVADLDGDGRDEVVFCVRNLAGATEDHAPKPYSQHHLMLFALRDGKLLWKREPAWANPLCAAYPMAFDADGDGDAEIFGMDWNTIGHKPGGWDRLGPAHAFAFTHEGDEIWHRAEDAWNAKPCIAATDWNGDGAIDIVSYAARRLEILDARTGVVVSRVDLQRRELTQGPVLADLDADGDTDAVVATDDRLLVIDTHAPVAAGGWPGWEAIAAGTNAPRPLPPSKPPATPSATPDPISIPSAALPTPAVTPPTPSAPTAGVERSAAIPWPGAIVVLLAGCAVALAGRR